jgi:spore germination protein YaaH
MSEQNPIDGKYVTNEKKIPWKHYFIFSSWFFLCLFSFYLGFGLIEWEEPSNLEKSSQSNVQQASMGEGVIRAFQDESETGSSTDPAFTKEERETFVFKNVLQEIFGSESAAEKSQDSNSFSQKPIPASEKPIRASTWFSDYEAMKKVVHLYDEIHPFIYSMKGGLTNNGELANSWSSTSKQERVEELRRLNPNVKIIPTIFRWENPKEKISENIGMNGRSDIRDKHIQIILNEIETYGYDGIDIDYEGMSCEKKEKFEEFIVLLSREMKKRNKILSVAVHPKTPNPKGKVSQCKGLKDGILVDFKENWRGPMTHDYEFLAKHVDRLKIMAYELHPRKYHNPGPGPQAPNTWLKDIIKYAKKRVPKEKLYMAIPTYGYDWALNCKAPAKSVYHSDVQRIKGMNPTLFQPTNINQILATKNSASWINLSKFSWVHENKVYEDPTLWYTSGGCDRVAFFMNRKAFEEKMNLLRKYEVAGFSFWQLISDNDPEINQYLELLVTNKLPKVEIANDLYQDEILAEKSKKSISEVDAAGLNPQKKLSGGTSPAPDTKLVESPKSQSPKKDSSVPAPPAQPLAKESPMKAWKSVQETAEGYPTPAPNLKEQGTSIPNSQPTKVGESVIKPIKEDIIYE